MACAVASDVTLEGRIGQDQRDSFRDDEPFAGLSPATASPSCSANDGTNVNGAILASDGGWSAL